MAMDALTSFALDDISGQTGVTIGFCGRFTVTMSYNNLSWGDPGGYATCGNSIGWLIFMPSSGTFTVSTVVADGQSLAIDIGRTSNTTCDVCGAAGSVMVPANKVFTAVNFPTLSHTINVPATMYVGLGSTAGTVTGTVGVMTLYNLQMTAGTGGNPDLLIIWAH